MNSADWWARKLGAPAPQQPPPQQYPQPQGYPADVAPPQHPAAYGQPAPDTKLGNINDFRARLSAGQTKGGPAARLETGKCPGCGSGNFFAHRSGNHTGQQAAPHCFDCGYPTVQYGSPTGAGEVGG